MAGKVIVTGATKGIGRATSLALATAGWTVGVLARTECDVLGLCAQIQSSGGRALPLPADVTNEAQVELAFQRAATEWGELDALVNNAGTGSRAPFVSSGSADWKALLELNVTGALRCTRAALQQMIPASTGCIVNVASRAGRHGEGGLAVYSATKAALIAFTQALAEEVSPLGIRVLVLCPGPVDTERLHAVAPDDVRATWLRPEQVAEAIVELLTGQGKTPDETIVDLFEPRLRAG
jgi:NAD(P)-dependent dehydrogenase (short-subunit alcohol dehydrogenase family)